MLNNTYCSAVRFQVCRHAVHCDYILTFRADSKTFVMLFLKTRHDDFPLGSVPWTLKYRTAVFNHTPAMLATNQICLSHLSLDRTTCEVSRLSHFPLPSSRFQSTVAVRALRHFVKMSPTQWGGRLQVLNHGALTSPRATACFMSALHCRSASQTKTASHVNERCATLHTCECNYAEPMKALCGCFSICFSATTGKVMHLCFGAVREKQARNLFSSFPARRTRYSNYTAESDGVYFIFHAF